MHFVYDNKVIFGVTLYITCIHPHVQNKIKKFCIKVSHAQSQIHYLYNSIKSGVTCTLLPLNTILLGINHV